MAANRRSVSRHRTRQPILVALFQPMARRTSQIPQRQYQRSEKKPPSECCVCHRVSPEVVARQIKSRAMENCASPLLAAGHRGQGGAENRWPESSPYRARPCSTSEKGCTSIACDLLRIARGCSLPQTTSSSWVRSTCDILGGARARSLEVQFNVRGPIAYCGHRLPKLDFRNAQLCRPALNGPWIIEANSIGFLVRMGGAV